MKVIICVLMAAISCAMAQPTDVPKSVAQFSVELYQKTAAKTPGNVIISPYSVAVAMALASQGAQGATFDQIASTLHLTKDKKFISDYFSSSFETLHESVGNTTLSIANKIYLDEQFEFKPTFWEVAHKYFNSEIENVKFAETVKAAETINHWVEDKTHNKIKNLVSSDSLSGAAAMFINAVYFRGKWQKIFSAHDGKKDKFWTGEQSVDLDFMEQEDSFNFYHCDVLDAKVLEMPFEDSHVSFWAFLPNKRDGLTELESKLPQFDLAAIRPKFNWSKVRVSMPKFHIEHTTQLKSILQEMGIHNAFGSADFSEMINSPLPFKFDDAIQKAFFEINEDGAEAGAATALKIVPLSLYVGPVEEFKADHPFLFALVVNNEYLFLGRKAQ